MFSYNPRYATVVMHANYWSCRLSKFAGQYTMIILIYSNHVLTQNAAKRTFRDDGCL
jgi:hypothetical protein